MKFLPSLAASVLLALTTGLSAAPRAEHVFIISVDGGSPVVIEQSEMPVLKRMVKQGAHSWHAQTIKPSLTLQSHASMLTGVPMEKHKITWNSLSPTGGVVTVPTVFTAAKKAGLSTAMFVGKKKLNHLVQPGTVDLFVYDASQEIEIAKSDGVQKAVKKEGNVFANAVAQRAAEYIVEHKPNLCFIHFTDTDTIGHEHGWGSPQQIKAFADTDAALEVIIKAIRKAGIVKSSVIILSADHGGHEKGHNHATPIDTQIPWIAWGAGVKKNYEIITPIYTCDTAATALWLLDVPPLAPMDGVVVTNAFNFK